MGNQIPKQHEDKKEVHTPSLIHREETIPNSIAIQSSNELSEMQTNEFVPRIVREMWNEIFSHLSHVELCRLSQVCRYFYILANEKNLWENLCKKRKYNTQGSDWKELFKSSQSVVRMLEIPEMPVQYVFSMDLSF